jgi:hypothetical protein
MARGEINTLAAIINHAATMFFGLTSDPIRIVFPPTIPKRCLSAGIAGMRFSYGRVNRGGSRREAL